MEIAQLRPKNNQRLLIVGATGTGKTTLAKELMRGYPSVLVIDPKCTYDPKDDRYKMVRSPSQLRWWGRFSNKKFFHYRPDHDHQTVADYDEVYRWAYGRRDIHVYTDETYLTMRGTMSPDYQRAVITCGRELGVGATFATQRPSGVDLRIYTESEHKICFYLANVDDRRRMREEMGDVVMTDPVIASGGEQYAFWYWNSKDRKTRLAQLTLREEA